MKFYPKFTRTIVVYVDKKYVKKIENENDIHDSNDNEENKMNYSEAVKAVLGGKRVRRPTWEDSQYMFSNGKILIHNTPYWENEKPIAALKGYPYICEHEDALASDWAVCA